MGLFENATRKQYRFPFKGLISVEDLWKLSLDDLNTVWKTLKKCAKTLDEESLLSTVSKEDKEVKEKLDIVKYIFDIKQEEADKAKKAALRREERQRLLEIKYKKENEALESASLEEINAKLAALDADEEE